MTTYATTTYVKNRATNLWRDEAGFVVSAELALILTLGVLAIIVGVHGVASAVNNEMADISSAFGTVDQSFMVTGFQHGGAGGFGFGGLHSFKSGSGFIDRADFCDCGVIVQVSSGAKVGGIGGGGVGAIGGGSASGAAATPAPAPAPVPMDCPPGTSSAIPCPPGSAPRSLPSVPCDDCPPATSHDRSPLPVPAVPFSR